MAQMKQCPQCGKYVPEDRTYCMNCGVTLGIRCPSCRGVCPVGAKACSCGHSFVKKKKGFHFPLLGWMKTNAKPLLTGCVALLLLLTLVVAAFPGLTLSVSEPEGEALLPILEQSATGYALMGYFLGGHPDAIEDILSMKGLTDAAGGMKALLFLSGLGWLTLLVGLLFSLLLLIPNYKTLGKTTSRRLYLPLGISTGGAALVFGLAFPLSAMLKDALSSFTADPEAEVVVSTFPAMPVVIFAAAAVVMLLHTLLHFLRLRNEAGNPEAELTVSRLVSVPVGAVYRFFRRIHRKLAKKRGKVVSEKDEPSFTLTHRFSTYLILLAVSLVFTQALLSKISNIFFWFLFLLPWVLLLYALLSRGGLSVSMLSDSATTEKNTPYTYQFRIDNRSPLALPFLEARVTIPQANSVRCTERTVRLSMAPMSSYHMKNTVSFRFRGTYDIGVKYFYVYDFFRLFRFRVDVENLTTVYVLPRRLTLDDTLAQAISDSTARTVRSPLVVDRLEVSDIRDYQNGDSLKSIHWKLSSKSESFIVKDYNTGTSNQTVVFCDLTPHFPDEPPKPKTPEGTPAEGEAPEVIDTAGMTPKEKKAALRAAKKAAKKSRKEKKEALRAAADLDRKKKRVKETASTHAISDEALKERLEQRAAVAETLDEKNGVKAAEGAESVTAAEVPELPNVHELASPAHYEDMNEYLADGVVELTIASVLAELRNGHEVTLLWFDRRSDTGLFAYPLRGADEFETIYHLFATAPLCAPDRKVTSLTAMISEIQSAKQMFVISTLDSEMLTDLSALPGVSDAGSFGSAEVVLYNPEERFRHPRERAAYLEGCREQLASSGLSLTAGSFNITDPATPTEGGKAHEA